MTDLTRRDALMLTAVIAATTSTVQAAQAQMPPAASPPASLPDDASLLVPPVNTVASSSIPITVKIPELVFTQAGLIPTDVSIEMKILDADAKDYTGGSSIFKTTLRNLALLPVGVKSPLPSIVMMTRLKVPADPKPASVPPPAAGQPAVDPGTSPAAGDQVKKKFVAMITMTYTDVNKKTTQTTVNAPQVISVKSEDCALSDVSLLRLSLQPALVPPNAPMTVRAVVPPAPATATPRVPSHTLITIVGSGAKLAVAVPAPVAPAVPAPAAPGAAPSNKAPPDFQMIVSNDKYLSDEVFVGFNLYPLESSQFMMDWSYKSVDGKGAPVDLQASAYAAVMPTKV